MQDVAALAGVSIKSVSRVINAEPHVSAKLREKVERAIEELNYVPDTAARSLAGGRSFTIGILFDNPSPNYTMKVLTGAYRACSARSYHLRVDTIDSSVPKQKVLRQLESILAHERVDGFILTPPLTDIPFVLDFLESRKIRYSRIAPFTAPGRALDVAIDDAAASAELAELLWGEGHRNFAIITGPEAHFAAEARRNGFARRLAELGEDYSLVESKGGFLFAQGIEAGREVLSTRPRPTAVFATNDDSAAGVLVACAQVGLRVPQDISVCGFDDSWVALSVWPYLTTIYQPIEELGEAAAELLLQRDQGKGTLSMKMLDYRLIKRDSDGPAPR